MPPPRDAADPGRRRARTQIDSANGAAAPLPPITGRRLTDDERRAIRERRPPRPAEAALGDAPALASGVASTVPRFAASLPSLSAWSRQPSARSIDAGGDRAVRGGAGAAFVPAGLAGVAIAAPGPTPGLTKPVPKMPKRHRQGTTTVKSRGIVALGAVLLAGVLVLAFAGGRLFGAAGGGDATGGGSDARAAFPVPAASPTLAYLDPPTPTPVPMYSGPRPPIVCLDPGHGGPERGFMRSPLSVLPNMHEADVVLEHAWDLEARLQRRGYDVVMTRRTDSAVNVDNRDISGDGKIGEIGGGIVEGDANLDELLARVEFCNSAKADLLVSMHVNGHPNLESRGYETWYTKERSFGDRNFAFAQLAYAHLEEQLGRIGYWLPPEERRGVFPDTESNVETDRPVYRHFIVTGPQVAGSKVKPSAMPGSIVEALFVSNDGDAYVLASPEGRDAIVTAYENAIVEYFEQYPPAA